MLEEEMPDQAAPAEKTVPGWREGPPGCNLITYENLDIHYI